jgi:hypothetical protein
MQFHRRLLGARVIGPGEQVQRQGNHGGVQGEGQAGDIDPGVLLPVESGRPAHQDTGGALKEPPVPVPAGVGEVGAGDVAPKAEVIEEARFGIQAGDDVAQALAIGQLPEAEGQEMIVLGQAAGRPGGGMFLNEPGKLRGI